MKQHDFRSHTAEENRRLSNLGHIVEGLIFGVVSILTFLSNFGFADWFFNFWPWLVSLAGLFLLVALYLLHPPSDWVLIWRDMQQRQHTLIAGLLVLAGLIEVIGKSESFWAYAWPTALLLIGGLFFIHEQHGTSAAAARAVKKHRVLGSTVILSGVLRNG